MSLDDRFVLDCTCDAYYATHPFAKSNMWRSTVVISLTWLWSIRSHSYFRRENWQWGEREGWRFNEMRIQYGKH
ncbi:3-oxo-5-alpha-steroid 4-dehydrogenase [Thalictrum thalictroides]|uniref:3-oxo-5-alpha-steroid 4-dehydrogenase n=1 Tax=Thalictrum thalictroides TaxID=46969 RepID=A0A7J6V3C1_THATH|nr:3-oxo-5-alpha-steroid 4-dehydrogenase [Thalictrum thalictroides]